MTKLRSIGNFYDSAVMQHYSFDHQFTDGSTILFIRLTIIALFHGRRPAPGPRGWPPQAPEFGPFEFCVWTKLCPFPEVHCWPSPPAPRWPQFGYLAEAPRGNYAIFHGPRPRPLRLATQAPEFGPFEFCVWRQLCPFPEVHCWPKAPPRPPPR